MKYLILSLLSISAFSATLECKQDGWKTREMFVKAKLSAQLEVTPSNIINLKGFELRYQIVYDLDDSAEDHWSRGLVKENLLSNTQGYAPRVYKDHYKFSTYANSFNRENDGFGYIDLILPIKNILKQDKTKPFTGYLIMTYMDDHFGGTAKIECFIN